MAKCSQDTPNLQLKMTAFMPAQVVVNINTLIQKNEKLKYEMALDLASYFQNSTQSGAEWTSLLDKSDLEALYKGLDLIKSLCDFSIARGLKLLVDAEYTYMNDGISAVALAMMCHYNQGNVYVGNTYQCYLKVIKTNIFEKKNVFWQRWDSNPRPRRDWCLKPAPYSIGG